VQIFGTTRTRFISCVKATTRLGLLLRSIVGARGVRVIIVSSQGGVFYRLEGDGKPRVVPKPAERTEILKKTHEEAGPLGVQRTIALLLTSYWGRGISMDVASVVRHCSACYRAKIITFSCVADSGSQLAASLLSVLSVGC
jgi:hypothetical protein